MSATKQLLFNEMSIEVPLTDCTNAVGNAENISRARSNGAKGKKKNSQTQDVLARLVSQQVQQTQPWDTVVSRRPAPLSIPAPSHPASPTVMAPYSSFNTPSRGRSQATTSATPNRCHNPYSPITMKGMDITAEESFFASYSETFTSSADISAISDASDVSADLHMAEGMLECQNASRRRTNTTATQMFMTSPSTLLRHMPVPRSQIHGNAPGTNTSVQSHVTMMTSASEAHNTSAATTGERTRVVRTVVGCSVDRASGRPIPRFVMDSSSH